MKRIEKYQIAMEGSMVHLKLPKGAKIILIGPDHEDNECVWVEFDNKNSDNLILRTLEVFTDGNIVPPLSTHVTSFRSANSMWHIYDHGEVFAATWETLMKSYVLGFAFTLAGQVALIEKTHPDWQAGRLNGIGGELDGGEGHNVAMVREFHEETGVVTDPADWEYRGIMRGVDWAVHVFTMTGAEVENVATLTDEKVFLLDLKEQTRLGNSAIENVRALIELCRIPVSQPSGVFPRFELQYG